METSIQVLEIAQAMAEATGKTDLDLLKSRYSESIIQQAWEILDENLRTQIQALSGTPKLKPRQTPPSITAHPKLWELSTEVFQLENAIADIQEQETLTEEEKETQLQELFSQWLSIEDDFEEKAVKVAHYIKNIEALTEARRMEYRRLRELAEQSEKQAERLRNYLVTNMERAGKKRIQGVTANLSLRKKPPKVILNVEPEQLPEHFKKVEITPRLSAIKDYLKTHSDCEFASISTQKEYSIMIK